MPPTPTPTSTKVPAWAVRLAPLAAVLTLAIWFRVPILVNANAINSDAAVVALQARHLLMGEWSWFLWGAGYQSVVDPLMIAVGFFLFGESPLVVMLVPLIGHLIVVALAYAVLARRTRGLTAAVLCVPLVFTPVAINLVIQYAARQWCVALVFLSVWLADRATERPGGWRWFGAAGMTAALSLYVDLYALMLVPGLGLLALLAAFDAPPGSRSPAGVVARRLGAWGAGALLGLIPVVLVRVLTGASGSQASVVFNRVAHNFGILKETALPYVLGVKVWRPGRKLYPDLWDPPAAYELLQVAGGLAFAVGLLSALVLFFLRALPWPVRRLGLFGVATAATSLVAFLVSPLPADMWSSRYLAPLVWMAPFAFAPLACRLGALRFGAVIAPYLVIAAVGGWLSYGLGVRGPLPAREPRSHLEGERKVARLLRERGIRYGAAQYWLAYRLSFLFGEDPVIVPLSAGEDRYPPYRRGFDTASTVAYIFHPSEPRAHPGQIERVLRAHGARYERHRVDGFTVLIQHDR